MTKSSQALKVNIHEVKTNLSRLLVSVQHGREVEICKKNKPIAKIIPLESSEKVSMLGSGRKWLEEVPDSFFDELTDEDLPGLGL